MTVSERGGRERPSDRVFPAEETGWMRADAAPALAEGGLHDRFSSMHGRLILFTLSFAVLRRNRPSVAISASIAPSGNTLLLPSGERRADADLPTASRRTIDRSVSAAPIIGEHGQIRFAAWPYDADGSGTKAADAPEPYPA